MGDQKADIIIFGATGFTGKYLVEECTKLKSSDFTWAVAGRSNEKMRDLLEKISLKTGIDVTSIPAINANCDDEISLIEMAKRGRVIINCCGPFRFTGESVVKACIQSGADYVDITGEPEFMDKMQLLYDDTAKAKDCYIINSCGMDSVPTDIGVLYFTKNFPGQVNYVESYMRLSNNRNSYEPICNATTWDSAVHGFSNLKNLIEIRRQLFSKMRKLKPQPLIPRRPTVHTCETFDNKYSIIFPGADRSVVVRTQMFLATQYNLRPIQYNAYMICDSFVILLAMLVVGYFLQTLTKYGLGRRMLMRYPEIFSLGMMSRNGPSEETSESTTGTFRFVGEGWSSEYLAKVNDPKTITDPTDLAMIAEWEIKNPAYGFTASSVLLSAITLIKERQNLPPNGGVYTPAAAFYKTKFLENLQNRGVRMTVLEIRRK